MPDWKPRDYQIDDLARHIKDPKVLNLSDPGTGKTIPTCLFAYFQARERKSSTVWAMPKSLLEKNQAELLRFSDFKPEEVAIVDGTRKKCLDILSDGTVKTFLMGFDALKNYTKSLPSRVTTLAVDEWHLGYKKWGSARTQALNQAVRNRFEYMVGMTGTLICGGLDTAFPAIHMIQPRYYGHEHAFNMRHVDWYDDNGRVGAWKNFEHLQKLISRHSIQHTFAEVYGPESKIIQIEWVDMSPKQKRAYDKFHEEALLELETVWLSGEQPGVAFLRARQILAHPEKIRVPIGWDEDGKPIKWVEEVVVADETTGKDERLKIHFSNGGPLVVFASLMPEQERIAALARECGLRVGLINSSVTASQRGKIDAAFCAGDLDVVVCSQQTAGVGFNWGHVDHIILASANFNDEDFLQAYRRAMRATRKIPLLITILIYKDSVDIRGWEIVKRKSVLANRIDPNREIIDVFALAA